LRKSLVDGVEIALIQLQYALADYYYRGDSNFPLDSGILDMPLRELRLRAISTQLAIDIARDAISIQGGGDAARHRS
jgi:hypothetical protein